MPDPAELYPRKDVGQLAEDITGHTGARITVTDDPVHAVSGVDLIHTDVWVSMGESKDVDRTGALLAPYQVNADLLRKARNPGREVHPLPARLPRPEHH